MLATALGAAQAWTGRHEMISDGISYLDLGEAWVRGDWEMAANAHWSPLYSWLLGLTLRVLQPAPQWEFPVVHLVNLGIYLGVLAAFDWFWRAVETPLPDWASVSLGYVLFLFTSLNMISLSIVTPDLCVAAFVYLAGGMVLRIAVRSSVGRWALLGLVLGLGYLAKAPLFLLAFLFLGLTFLAASDRRKAAPGMLVGALIFASLAGPLVFALSRAKGRLTFGDSGRLNYAWMVNGVRPFIHWQGGPPGCGAPAHGTRKVFASPPLYEFATPVRGTYPPWNDPSYWYEGVTPHFEWRGQLRRLFESAKAYYDIAFSLDAVIVGLIVLSGLGGQRLRSRWPMLVAGLGGLGLYAVVLVEGRYVAPFVMLVIAAAISALRLPAGPEGPKVTRWVVAAMLALLLIRVAGSSSQNVATAARDLLSRGGRADQRDWLVARGLGELGLRHGDPVGMIGHRFVGEAYGHYWARLARLRIVAEIPSEEAEDFPTSSPEVKACLLKAFARAGAKAVVARRLGPYGATPGWRKIPGTDCFVYLLPR